MSISESFLTEQREPSIRRGKTVYEVKFPDEVLQIFDEKDIEKVSE